MVDKTLDEQVNDLAKHFAQLIVDKDFHIGNLNTSGKLRLKCGGEYNRLVNKIDGIVEVWVQASQL